MPPPKGLSPWRVKRDRMAQAKGYRDYYDYRLHGSGRTPPSAPLPERGKRQAARGHVGGSDLVRAIRSGHLIYLTDGIRAAAEKDVRGRFILVRKTVINMDTGAERHFALRNVTEARMRDYIRRETEAGGEFSNAPSLDQRRLVD